VPLKIEDYAVIGDTHTAALVGRDGSIDWLCLPRFDSGACFARLLGGDRNGFWRLAPVGAVRSSSRRYRGDTMVLETELTTDSGVVRIVDCMPVRERFPEVVRVVEGVSGSVPMELELVIRFDYGSIVPWVSHADGLLSAVAGPDAVALWTPVELEGRDMATRASFTVHEGASIPFVLSWYPSHQRPPRPIDGRYAIAEAERWWSEWSSRCTYKGRWRDAVVRSLLTLKVLTYAPTGGIVAAVTTSLPEQLGGARNWDYRYCWVRDATLTLRSLLAAGYREEAESWRDWLLRSVAGDPADLQIMYGPAGERRLDEMEVPWLAGYESSRPVRIGNAAAGQFQLDVYGELMDSLHAAREVGITPEGPAWSLQEVVLEWLEDRWRDPDDGIWEVRGPRRHFTHSKIMAWVAFDRAVRAIEQFGLPGPLERWRRVRDEIHAEVCEKGWNPEVGAFTQYYGATELDASVLMMIGVGFLPPSDERVVRTVEAVAAHLTRDGFVLRYDTETGQGVDGLEGSEGAFLACSFWMVDALGAIGRRDEAEALFERLVGLANDVGLLAEEYDPNAKRQVGNFPQAFSHVSLINSALTLDGCAPWSRAESGPKPEAAAKPSERLARGPTG